MRLIPATVEQLIAEFGRLPGIGPRTAERLTFYLLRQPAEQATELGEAIQALRQNLQTCQTCFNLAEASQCEVCRAPSRQRNILAVVEEPLDVIAIEKTGQFNGLYHVLGGVISPIDGIGPAQLQIESLLARVDDNGIEEIILATNPSTEGETTALFIKKQMGERQVNITRLARGLPVGGDLEYADQITLGRALNGRQAF